MKFKYIYNIRLSKFLHDFIVRFTNNNKPSRIIRIFDYPSITSHNPDFTVHSMKNHVNHMIRVRRDSTAFQDSTKQITKISNV